MEHRNSSSGFGMDLKIIALVFFLQITDLEIRWYDLPFNLTLNGTGVPFTHSLKAGGTLSPAEYRDQQADYSFAVE